MKYTIHMRQNFPTGQPVIMASARPQMARQYWRDLVATM